MPAGWDRQAATVWVAAAARAGTLTAAALPASGVVEFRDGGAAHVVPSSGTAEVGVLGPDPEAALADLLHFATPAEPDSSMPSARGHSPSPWAHR